MIEERRKNVLLRTAVVVGFTLFLVLGLFLFLEYQSRTIGLAVERESTVINNLVTNPSFEPPAADGEPAPYGWQFYEWGGENATPGWISYTAFSGIHSVYIIGQDDIVGAAWKTDSRFPIEDTKGVVERLRIRRGIDHVDILNE